MGLRFEFDVPRYELQNRLSYWDLNAPSPISVPGYNLKGVYKFADNNTRSPFDRDKTNFGPRLAFAYALTPKTAIRAGAGIFYTLSRATVAGHTGSPFNTDSAPQWSLDSNATRYATLSNPYPNALTLPLRSSQGDSTFLGLGAGTIVRSTGQNPELYNWNASIQREVGWDSLIEINYTGNRGVKLPDAARTSLSLLDPSNWLGANVKYTRQQLQASVNNPFYGIITDPKATNLNRQTVHLYRLLRPMPQFDGAYGSEISAGDSWYQGLQVRWQKRFSKGLSMLAHYTWSKMLDTVSNGSSNLDWLSSTSGRNLQSLFDYKLEKSHSSNDVAHRFVATAVYQVPLGHDRQSANNLNRAVDAVIGGWEAGGFFTLQSSQPLFVLAPGAYRMPLGMALSAAAYGAAFGLFPISWIVYWAIVLYRVTLETGRFEIIKDSIGSLTNDPRLPVLLIAFAFGAFVEGAVGFGTPVAVAAAMLTGLGFSPFYASAVCLLANTAPVAFGSIGIPVITLAGITGLPLERVSAAVGHICAPVSFIIPAYLTAAMGGRRALAAVWPAALVVGGTFAGVQFLVANYIGAQLTDILSSLSAICALVAMLRYWRPRDQGEPQIAAVGAAAARTTRVETGAPHHPVGQVLNAWMPYGLLVFFVLLWGFKPVQGILNSVTSALAWPFPHNLVRRRPPVVAEFWLDYFRSTHSDAACLSAGGCVAYYPTKVPLHYRSKYLGDRDCFGDLVAGCRKLGMNVVARTDPHAATTRTRTGSPPTGKSASTGPIRSCGSPVASVPTILSS